MKTQKHLRRFSANAGVIVLLTALVALGIVVAAPDLTTTACWVGLGSCVVWAMYGVFHCRQRIVSIQPEVGDDGEDKVVVQEPSITAVVHCFLVLVVNLVVGLETDVVTRFPYVSDAVPLATLLVTGRGVTLPGAYTAYWEFARRPGFAPR